MKTHLDCIPCFLRQALQAARFVTNDEQKQEEVLRAALSALQQCNFCSTPPEIAHKVHFAVMDILGVNDPYQKVKAESNTVVLTMYKDLQKDISTSDDPLDMAVRLSIAGNIMDYGAREDFDIFKTIARVKETTFAINHTQKLKQDLDQAETIAYIADNAGEIVFDKLFMETVDSTYSRKKWHLYVKSCPMVNDATEKDLRQVAFCEMDNISTGLITIDREYDSRTDPVFLEALKKKDIVISKGQGNYEALSTADLTIYFLLMVKCPVVAEDITADIGDIVVIAKKN
ncbi:MAG: DUF89 family protein [Theionarchaea archaeon]|nr:DUF89 family protein [Theionarchaea archaeon]